MAACREHLTGHPGEVAFSAGCCATYYDRPAEFKAMRLRGMRQDFSWRRSAERYVDLYRWAVAARTGAPA